MSEPEHHDVHYTRKDTKKANTTNKCGSCYGAESATLTCCNTCEEVGRAHHAGEACLQLRRACDMQDSVHSEAQHMQERDRAHRGCRHSLNACLLLSCRYGKPTRRRAGF